MWVQPPLVFTETYFLHFNIVFLNINIKFKKKLFLDLQPKSMGMCTVKYKKVVSDFQKPNPEKVEKAKETKNEKKMLTSL